MTNKWIFLLFFASLQIACFAQPYELYNAYKLMTHYDNMINSYIPAIVHQCYYDNVQGNNVKMSQVINITQQTRTLLAYTKKAQSGYLQINEKSMTYIDEKISDRTNLNLEYELDGIPVSTCESVKKLISLKERQIKSVEFVEPSPDNGNTLTVRITTLKGNGS